MNQVYFIYSHKHPSYEKEVILFRKNFTYDGLQNIVIGITADTRYFLYLNGKTVCRGPECGDSYRKYYDEIDITNFLKKGENCIAVKVLHYPPEDDGEEQYESGPARFVRSAYGGLCVFSLNGNQTIYTDDTWKCFPDRSYGFKPSVMAKQAGDMEHRNALLYEDHWNEVDYDDSEWENAEIIQEMKGTDSASVYGILYRWILCRRDIPMEEEQQIWPESIRSKSLQANSLGMLNLQHLQIPPFSEVEVEFDMGRLVTAYVKSIYGEGGCANAEYLYSECYYHWQKEKLVKVQRDDWKNGILAGETDILDLSEGEFIYEPFEYRTFRYLRIIIRTKEKSATLNDLIFKETSYPFHSKAKFTAEKEILNQIWKVSLHTLRCCMHDTYIDCPYYERLQYVMDTMIEAAHTYPVLGDDRLVRKAFLDFAGTQMENGMIHCDAPANERHIIPGFGIYYIDMLYQHYQYYADEELVKRYWAVCVGILSFFEQHVDSESNLVTKCGYWEFVDWTKEWDATQGVPVEKGEVQYIYSLMYAYGLLKMSELTEMVYGKGMSQHWRSCYEIIKDAVNFVVWDSKAGYYRTSEHTKKYSQHAQVWAILSECIEKDEAAALGKCMLGDESLIPCSYAMLFYYNRALEKVGIEDKSLTLWKTYEELINRGATTWPEDPVNARSDCHGWSTIPINEICHVLLGIKPQKPGFKEILIEPKLLELGSMQGEIWTPEGIVRVEREIEWVKQVCKVKIRFSFEKEIKVTVKLAGKDIFKGISKNGECCTVLE